MALMIFNTCIQLGRHGMFDPVFTNMLAICVSYAKTSQYPSYKQRVKCQENEKIVI